MFVRDARRGWWENRRADADRGKSFESHQIAGVGDGELSAEISRRMVQLHKEYFGKGPTKARTYITEELVVCVLEGGFSKGERTLVAHGKEDAIVHQREAVQEVVRERFIEIVEELLARNVASFISGVDAVTQTSAEVFVLEPLDV
jgi:uncharacterized protein YbcI